jgi:hypothetical protein
MFRQKRWMQRNPGLRTASRFLPKQRYNDGHVSE